MTHAALTIVPPKIHSVRASAPRVGAIPRRPLGNFERLFWNLNQNHPVHFVVAAEVVGQTAVRAWESAIRAAQRRHPLLSCSIEIQADNTPWWCGVDSPIPLRVVEGWQPSAWDGEIERELSEAFARQQAPLARATLLHSKDRCVFLLTSHHSVADGTSLVLVLRDVLRSVAGDDLEAYNLPASQEALLGEMPADLAAMRASEDTPALPPHRPVQYRTQGQGSVVVKRLRLSPEATRKLGDRARREGVTVHAALNAAIALASQRPAKGEDDPGLRILSPIRIRKLLGLREECLLGVCAGTVSFQMGEMSAFWDVARQAKVDLQKYQTPQAAWAMGDAIDQILEQSSDFQQVAECAAQALAYEILLTNLGRDLIESSFGTLRIDALWGPAVLLGYEGEQTIGAATLNDSLCLTHTSYAPDKSLLNRIERLLFKACD